MLPVESEIIISGFPVTHNDQILTEKDQDRPLGPEGHLSTKHCLQDPVQIVKNAKAKWSKKHLDA